MQAQRERIRAEEAPLRASSWEADKLISRAAGDTAVGPPGLARRLGVLLAEQPDHHFVRPATETLPDRNESRPSGSTW